MNGGILTFLVTVPKGFAQCPGCLLNDNPKHSLAYASGYLFYRRSSPWLWSIGRFDWLARPLCLFVHRFVEHVA